MTRSGFFMAPAALVAVGLFLMASISCGAATPAPTIVSGTILTPAVDVSNQKAGVVVSYTVNAPGQYSSASFVLTSPSGRDYFLLSETVLPGATTGSFKAGTVFAFWTGTGPGGASGSEILHHPLDYLEPGTYTLTSGSVVDLEGKGTSYTRSQLATLFGGGTLTVVNRGKVDVTPPTLVSGTILTPTVSLSARRPYLAMRLDVSDDAVGFSSIEITALYNGVPPAGYPSAIVIDGATAVPVTRGTVVAFKTDFDMVAPGKYTMFDVNYICDSISNCGYFGYGASISSLFGGKSTFEITK